MQVLKASYIFLLLSLISITQAAAVLPFGMLKLVSNTPENLKMTMAVYLPLEQFQGLEVSHADTVVYAGKGIVKDKMIDKLQISKKQIGNDYYINITSNEKLATDFFVLILQVQHADKQYLYSALVDLSDHEDNISLLYETAITNEHLIKNEIKKAESIQAVKNINDTIYDVIQGLAIMSEISKIPSALDHVFNNYNATPQILVVSKDLIWIAIVISLLVVIFSNRRKRKFHRKVSIGQMRESGSTSEIIHDLKILLQQEDIASAIVLLRRELHEKGLTLVEFCNCCQLLYQHGIDNLPMEVFAMEVQAVEVVKNDEQQSVDRLYGSQALILKHQQHKISSQRNANLRDVTDDLGAAKLNLAIFYLNMQDLSSAKELLQQVIKIGNAEQCSEAKDLIQQITNQ